MNQRLLHKTIESFNSRSFISTEDLLVHVLQQIVKHDKIDIQGGRVWKLDAVKYSYELIGQAGTIQKIKPRFTININDYKMFKSLPRHRTVVAKETNTYLKSKGIIRYSATGVGDIEKVKGEDFYKFVLSFNTNLDHDAIAPTLNIISVAVTSMLKNRKIEKASSQMQKDLDKARDIQRSILPAHELQFHNFEMFGISLADRIVGGDFFDYVESEEKDRVGIVVGDAASKGLSAAVQALYVSGALRMGASYQTQIGKLVSKINDLVHHTFTDDRFLTLFYAELSNDKKGLCLYVNAGHSNPLIYREKTGRIETLAATGNIIGPFPGQTYRTEGVMIEKGDVLLIYTDGVTEAMNAEGEQYSESRLEKRLTEYFSEKAQTIARLIIEDVQKFSAKGKYTDDKTIVVIKRVK